MEHLLVICVLIQYGLVKILLSIKFLSQEVARTGTIILLLRVVVVIARSMIKLWRNGKEGVEMERNKKLGDFKKGGKSVLPDLGEQVDDKGKIERIPQHYKLRATEFKVEMGSSGAAYIVVDVVVVNECEQQGMHTELGFSLSEASESIAAAWFTALGCDDETAIPLDNRDRIQKFLDTLCKGAVFEADVIVSKYKGYPKNDVSPPWGLAPADLEKGDKAAAPGPAKKEEPGF